MTKPNKPQPEPKPGNQAVWDLVIADIKERDQMGVEKYGQRLQTHDGRDSLIDAYQEQMDGLVYLRKEIEERTDLRAALDVAVEELTHLRDDFHPADAPGTSMKYCATKSLAEIERIMGKGEPEGSQAVSVDRSACPSPEPTQPDIAQARADGLALRDEIVRRQKAPTPEPEPVVESRTVQLAVDNGTLLLRVGELEAELAEARELLEVAERERDELRASSIAAWNELTAEITELKATLAKREKAQESMAEVIMHLTREKHAWNRADRSELLAALMEIAKAEYCGNHGWSVASPENPYRNTCCMETGLPESEWCVTCVAANALGWDTDRLIIECAGPDYVESKIDDGAALVGSDQAALTKS